MARTNVLTDNFSLGRVSDVPPDRMKPNSAIVMTNLIPDYMNSSLVVRPGWSYSYLAHADFTFFSASTTSISGSNFAPFSDGNKLVYVDQVGRILSTNTSGVGALLDATGLATTQGGPGVFHLDRLVLPVADGAHFPWYVSSNGSGTASATAFADPFPKARVGASWGAYLLMANGGDFANSYTINRRRLWFSNPGLFTFTAANNSYWDFPQVEEITAVVPMANSIIVFGPRDCHILTGDTPPPNNNLIYRPLYPYGCVDRNAVKTWNGYVIFANERGLFKTDGTQLVDITQIAGLSNGWRNDFYNFSNSYTCALGIFQNYAVVTVTDGSVEKFTYLFDLEREVGFNFSGFPTVMYAEIIAGPHGSTSNSEVDLIFGILGAAQAGRMQPVFSVGTSSGQDGNAVVFPWELQTPMYRLGVLQEKRLRRAYFSYDWDATSPQTETIEFSYNITNDPFTGPSWNVVTSPPTGTGRQPIFVNNKGRYISFRLRGGQGVGTKQFDLHGIELEQHAKESSRSSS